MDKPLIVVNFKTYETAMGDSALTLAKAMDNFTDRDFRMIAVVSAFDLSTIVIQCLVLRYGLSTLTP